MPKQTLYTRLWQYFSGEDVDFTRPEKEHIERIEKLIELRMEDLAATDTVMFSRIRNVYPTYCWDSYLRDMALVERTVAFSHDPEGDPHKVFQRYFITEIAKEAISIARTKNDGYTMAYSANIIGKHNMTDQPDIQRLPFEKIVPFIPEPTLDPSILGLKPIENQKQLKEKYMKKFLSIRNRFTGENLEIEDVKAIEDNGK